MKDYIDGINFVELEPMKYYAPPNTWDKEKIKTTVRNRVFSGEWIAAEKMDGFFGKFVKDEDGNMGMYSRSRGVNNQYANKIEWLPQLKSYFEDLPNGTCLLGELYLHNKPGSKNVQTIMGCVKDKAIERQSKGETFIRFYVFDILAWNGESYLNKSYVERTEKIKEISGDYMSHYVRYAKWYRGAELWEELQKLLAAGHEGMVLIHEQAIYEPGKRPSKTTLKVKKEISQTIDCFFTGVTMPPTHLYTGKEVQIWQYWEDIITGEKKQGLLYKDYVAGATIQPVTKGWFFGWAGSLEIGVLRRRMSGFIDGKWDIEPIGWLSNVPESIKSNPKLYERKPIEVSAMEVDFDPDTTAISLRHARMLRFRDDLTIQDCLYSKITG